MKNSLYILLLLLFSSGFSQTKAPELTVKIANDFLEQQLKNVMYKNYTTEKYDWCLVEEPLGCNNNPVSDYEYNYDSYSFETGKIPKPPSFPVNRKGIKKLKKQLEKANNFLWQKSDFEKYNFTIIKCQLIGDNIKSGKYIYEKPKLVFSISPPVFIDKNKVLLGFNSTNTKLGSDMITHFTFLMINENGKWKEMGGYWDGVFQ